MSKLLNNVITNVSRVNNKLLLFSNSTLPMKAISLNNLKSIEVFNAESSNWYVTHFWYYNDNKSEYVRWSYSNPKEEQEVITLINKAIELS